MIRTSTILDNDHLKAVGGYNRSLSAFRSAVSLLLIFAVIIVFAMIRMWSILQKIPLLWIMAEFTLGLALFTLLRGIFNLLKKPKAPKDAPFAIEHFFEEDCFSSVTHRAFGEFKLSRRYESIEKAAEWRGWFLIYLTKDKISVIKSSELIDGTPEELREFLKDKLGTRFNKTS